jgi:hypothetical protein
MDSGAAETLRFERARLLHALRAPAASLARVIRARASVLRATSRHDCMFEASEGYVLRRFDVMAKEARLRAELGLDPERK